MYRNAVSWVTSPFSRIRMRYLRKVLQYRLVTLFAHAHPFGEPLETA